MAKKPAFDWDDKKAVERLRKQATYLSSTQLARGTAQALNRAGVAARKALRMAVTKSVTAKSTTIGKGFKPDKKATAARNAYIITIDASRRIQLREYTITKGKEGVFAKVFKNGKKELLRGTFRVESLGNAVLTRRGKARGPLKTLYGPSTAQLAPTRIRVLQRQFDIVFQDRIQHEITQRVRRSNT